MSQLEVNKVIPQSGTTLTLGESGDTISIPSGATFTPTLTAPIIDEINDNNGNEEIIFTTTASAVNELTIANAATGNAPEIAATGGDTDIDLKLTPKGAGNLVLDGIEFPNADGSANQALVTNGSGVLSFAAVGGLTDADCMNFNGTNAVSAGVTTTLSTFVEPTYTSFGRVGSGMSESSGIFTFPSTGIYLVFFHGYLYSNTDVTYVSTRIQGTNNNSSYVTMVETDISIKNVSGNTYTESNIFALFDVQDTANYKVRFQAYGTHDFNIGSNAGITSTGVYFLKLGET
jgi:hypothetical protein